MFYSYLNYRKVDIRFSHKCSHIFSDKCFFHLPTSSSSRALSIHLNCVPKKICNGHSSNTIII